MLKCLKQICQKTFPVVAILLQQPENSDRSERSSKISGRCDKIVPTGKKTCLSDRQFFPVGAMKLYRPEKSDRSERSSKISGRCINRKKNLSVRPSDFFCLSYRGQVCGQRGSLPLSVRLLQRQNFGSPSVEIMISCFAGNDLANDLALTPANFLLPRQKYSTTKK